MKRINRSARVQNAKPSIPFSYWLNSAAVPLGDVEIESLARQWQVLCKKMQDRKVLGELRSQRQGKNNLLVEMRLWLKIGCYPPPEILIGLYQRFDKYLQASGKLDLETALIERPKQRAGNFAKQRALRVRDGALAWELGTLESRGLSREAAAECAIASLASYIKAAELPAIDADSLSRRHRGRRKPRNRQKD